MQTRVFQEQLRFVLQLGLLFDWQRFIQRGKAGKCIASHVSSVRLACELTDDGGRLNAADVEWHPSFLQFLSAVQNDVMR